MAEKINENTNVEEQPRPVPQLRRRRGSKSLANLEQSTNPDILNTSTSEQQQEQTKTQREKGYIIRKFQRSYSQIMKEIEELKPQKQTLSAIQTKQSYMDMKSNKTQRQRVDELYHRLSQKYKLQKVSQEEIFQKAIGPFKELKTFVDLKDKIQELNIIENKDFKKNLEILKIRDKVTQINEELNRKSEIEDAEGVQQLTFKENMLNSIKQNYDASLIKNQRQTFNKKLLNYLNSDTQIDNVDENQMDWSKLPAPFHSYLKNFMVKQKKSNAMKKREEGIKQNIVESYKEKEFRQRVLESQYDLSGQAEQKFPQNQYYEHFKRKTDQIILEAKRQVTREFRKSFNLGSSNIQILNLSKQGASSPKLKGVKSQSSNDNFFLTENANTNSNNILIKGMMPPLSKIQSQSNSSTTSLVSSVIMSPRQQQTNSQSQSQQFSEIKSKFIAFKRNERSSTVDDSKSNPLPNPNELRNVLYSNKESAGSLVNKPHTNIEKISRQVSKIISTYKDDVQKILDERERRELEGLNNSSILNISSTMKYNLRNDRSDHSILNVQNNSFRSNSHNHFIRQKSDQILTVQRGVMKKFIQQIEDAEESYQIEKSDINVELKLIQNEIQKQIDEMNEQNQFNWQGLSKNDLADQVVNHYLFSKLRQRRIKSQQEFLRQSKITRTNF